MTWKFSLNAGLLSVENCCIDQHYFNAGPKKARPNRNPLDRISMTETYIIIGNARSGTSLTAGLLSIFGISMDADIMAPDRFAPKGYYESDAAKNINYRIFELARPGFEYPNNQHLWYHPTLEDIQAQVGRADDEISAFVAAGNKSEKWGFKSPITALTLDHFLPHVSNPKIIATVRNPLENAEVAHLIYGVDFLRALKAVNYCNYVVAKQIEEKQLDHIFINFTDYKTDAMKVAEDLAKFCGIEMTADMRRKVNNFVIKGQFGKKKYSSRLTRRKMEIKTFFRKLFSSE